MSSDDRSNLPFCTGSEGEDTSSCASVLSEAPPHPGLFVLWYFFFFSFVYMLPSTRRLDRHAKVETFTRRIFPNRMTIKQLAIVRLAFAAVIWITTIQAVLSPIGTEINTFYLPGSKLKPTRIELKGFRTLLPYTTITWVILGISFTLTGYIAWVASSSTKTKTTTEYSNNKTATDNTPISPFVLRSGLVFWQLAAPPPIFVSAAVRYLIWEMVLDQGGDTSIGLRDSRHLVLHNFNVFSVLAEIALLGGLPIHWLGYPIGGLAILAYLQMSNLLSTWWVDVTFHGPQFLYFFFDSTIEGFAFPAGVICALLGGGTIIFGVFVWLFPKMLSLLPRNILFHSLFVVGISSTVMRFRD